MRTRVKAGIVLLVLLAGSVLVGAILQGIMQGSAPYLPGWTYRRQIVVTGSTVGAQTDYPVRVDVHYGPGTDSGNDIYLDHKCRTDFGDIRFTSVNGMSEQTYRLESKTDGAIAIFWVEVIAIPASPDKATIFIYYGKLDATTTSSDSDSALFFDHFANMNAWTQRSGLWTIVNDTYLKSPSADGVQIATSSFTARNMRMRLSGATINDGSFNCGLNLLLRTPDSNNFYRGDFWNTGVSQDTWSINKWVGGVFSGPLDSGTHIDHVSLDTSFHTLEVAIYSTAFSGSYDDAYFLAGADDDLSANTYIGFRYGGSAFAYTLVDWVWVVKFVDPEPSITDIGEETRSVSEYLLAFRGLTVVLALLLVLTRIMFRNWFAWSDTGILLISTILGHYLIPPYVTGTAFGILFGALILIIRRLSPYRTVASTQEKPPS